MLQFNICNFFFASSTLALVVIGTLINLCESSLPPYIVQVFKYGKFAHTKNALVLKTEVPKSYFKHFYLTAALIYWPVAYYQVLSAYLFGNEVPSWFNNILDFSCGSNRKATGN